MRGRLRARVAMAKGRYVQFTFVRGSIGDEGKVEGQGGSRQGKVCYLPLFEAV